MFDALGEAAGRPWVMLLAGAGVILAAMLGVIILQVVSLYVFCSSLSWTEELSKLQNHSAGTAAASASAR